MAEKGLLTLSVAGGTSVATRSAAELDDLSAARVIPLVDASRDHVPVTFGTPTRTITSSDGYIIPNAPAELTNNLITCGDKHSLVVYSEFTAASGGQSASIIPVLFDNEASPNIVGALAELETDGIWAYQTANSGRYPHNALTWEVYGAYKIGILIPYLSSSALQVWGFMI